MLLDPPALQVNIDLEPYEKHVTSLRLIKVDEDRDTFLPPWKPRSLSEYWPSDRLPVKGHLHVVVKVSPIGKHKWNFMGRVY